MASQTSFRGPPCQQFDPRISVSGEAQSLEAAGIDIIIVFETTAEEILNDRRVHGRHNTAVSEANSGRYAQ